MNEFIPFSVRMGLKPRNIKLNSEKKIFYQKLKYLVDIFKYFQKSYLNEDPILKVNHYYEISSILNRIDIDIMSEYDFNSIYFNTQYIEYFNSFKSIFTLNNIYNDDIVTLNWTNSTLTNNIKTFHISVYIDCTEKIDSKALTLLQLFQLI